MGDKGTGQGDKGNAQPDSTNDGQKKNDKYPKWSNEFLLDVMGDTPVSVAVTMDGRADAVVWLEDSAPESELPGNDAAADHDTPSHTTTGQYVFATPYNVNIPFSTALRHLLGTQRHLPMPTLSSPISSTTATLPKSSTTFPPTPPIIYLQAQNDCLRSEYPLLQSHLPTSLLHPSWITSVLGSAPEAINLWIGTKHSVSTLHSDPYENLYVVLRGRKRFVLAPPGEGWFYGKEWVKTASWVEDENENEDEDVEEGRREGKGKIPRVKLVADEAGGRIPWYPIANPLSPSPSLLARSPRLAHRPKPYTVTVEAGDLLYLPRGWLHHVEQEEDEDGLCVAVNSWFEGWDGGMGREWAWEGFARGVDRIVARDENGDGKGDEEDEEEGDEEGEEHGW